MGSIDPNMIVNHDAGVLPDISDTACRFARYGERYRTSDEHRNT
jgi:hypothetical protein